MPAPSSGTYEYSAAALQQANQAFLDLIDAGTGAGTITVFDSSDVQLAQAVLDDPGGSVDGGTGQLTLTIATQEDSADASGTAAYAEIADSDGTVHLSIECAQGSVPASGYLVLNTLSIVAAAPVTIVSATIG